MNRSTITTVTGKHVDPLHPAAQDLDMLDIAHALSLLCRGGGQTKTFYSVAQHSISWGACCTTRARRICRL